MSSHIRMQADDFLHASQVLENSFAKTSSMFSTMGPSVVCLAFSLELYIKDVYVALGRKPPKHHKILELFEGLDEEIKQEIFSHESICQNPWTVKGVMFPRKKITNGYDGFLSHIEEMSNAFVDWRYFHEGKTASLNYNSSFALDLINALKTAAYNIRRRSAVQKTA